MRPSIWLSGLSLVPRTNFFAKLCHAALLGVAHAKNLYLEMGVLYSVRCSSYAITIYSNLTPEAPPAGSMHSDTKKVKVHSYLRFCAVPSQTRSKVYLATSTPLHVFQELAMTKSLARAEG